MDITDKQIADAWRRTRNYAEVGRELDRDRQTIRMRVLKLRAAGWDLPESRPAGYVLTSDRAREIGKLRKDREYGHRS